MKRLFLLITLLLLAACSRPEAGKTKALNPTTADPGAIVATRNVDYALPAEESAPEGYVSSYDTGDSSGGRSVVSDYYVNIAAAAQALPVTAQHDEDHGAPHGEDAEAEEAHGEEAAESSEEHGAETEAAAEDHGESESGESESEASHDVADQKVADEAVTDEAQSEARASAESGEAAEPEDEGILSNITDTAAAAAAALAGGAQQGVEATREAVAEGVEVAGEAVDDAAEAVAEVLEPEADAEANEIEASTDTEPAEEATEETSEEPAEEAPADAPSEEPAETEGEGEASEADAAAFDWQAIGETTYSANCVSCHQANGAGIPGAFPPLAGHIPNLYNAEGGREYIINVVLYGLQGEINVQGSAYNGIMTPWGQLSDEEIAATLNHELTSWDNEALLNDFSPILPEEVAALRGQGLAPGDVLGLRPAVAE